MAGYMADPLSRLYDVAHSISLPLRRFAFTLLASFRHTHTHTRTVVTKPTTTVDVALPRAIVIWHSKLFH